MAAARGSVTCRIEREVFDAGETIGSSPGYSVALPHDGVGDEASGFTGIFGISRAGTTAPRITDEGVGRWRATARRHSRSQALCLASAIRDAVEVQAEYEKAAAGGICAAEGVPSRWRWRANTQEDICDYVNRAYLGAGVGFEAASQRYFGKSAKDVTAAEAAMLAGLLKAPSTFAPTASLDRAQTRAAVVVGLMEEQGYLTKAEADEARANPATLSKAAKQASGGYFADWVMERHRLPAPTDRYVIIETTLYQDMQKRRGALAGCSRQAEPAPRQAASCDERGGAFARWWLPYIRRRRLHPRTQALRHTVSTFKPSSTPRDDLGTPAHYVEDVHVLVTRSGDCCPQNRQSSRHDHADPGAGRKQQTRGRGFRRWGAFVKHFPLTLVWRYFADPGAGLGCRSTLMIAAPLRHPDRWLGGHRPTVCMRGI